MRARPRVAPSRLRGLALLAWLSGMGGALDGAQRLAYVSRMREIHAHIEIAAPIDRVFEAMSDHATFITGRQARCTVTRPGKSEKNGLGAVREVDALGLHFVEEVVGFERPRRYDYIVRTISIKGRTLPFAHDAGWLEFSEHAGKTRVDWLTRFRVPIPVLGYIIERMSGRKLAATFLEGMTVTKTALERG